MLAEQHIRIFPTTENNIVKSKSNPFYCIAVVVNHGFQKMLLLRKQTNGQMRLVPEVCANVSFERYLRMKVMNGIAWVVHLT